MSICEAIASMNLLSFSYNGFLRIIEPRTLGHIQRGIAHYAHIRWKRIRGAFGMEALFTPAKSQTYRAVLKRLQVRDPDIGGAIGLFPTFSASCRLSGTSVGADVPNKPLRWTFDPPCQTAMAA